MHAQVLLLFVIEVLGSRLFGGKARLPANTKHLKGSFYGSSAHEPREGEAIAVIHMYGSSQFPGYRQRSGFKHEVPHGMARTGSFTHEAPPGFKEV
jgi:hypothetical protein